MRVYLVLLLIILMPCGGSSQNKLDPQKGDAPLIRDVKFLLRQPQGISTGFSDKKSNRLGDSISVALLKIFTEEELRNPQIVSKFLPIIRASFLSPNLIPPKNRSPKFTLPLLIRLEKTTDDARLKREISDLMRFIRDQMTSKR
jgi:hypothetical protein